MWVSGEGVDMRGRKGLRRPDPPRVLRYHFSRVGEAQARGGGKRAEQPPFPPPLFRRFFLQHNAVLLGNPPQILNDLFGRPLRIGPSGIDGLRVAPSPSV